MKKFIIVSLCLFLSIELWGQKAEPWWYQTKLQADTTKDLSKAKNLYQNLLDTLTHTLEKQKLEKQIMQKSLQEAKIQKQFSLWGFIIAGIGILIVAGLIVKNIRQKDLLVEQQQTIEEQNQKLQAQTEELRQQQEEIATQRDDIIQKNKILAEKNKLIEENIRVASRIQKMILPKEKDLQNVFSNFIVMAKPRDIVNGDFYWVGKVGTTSIVALIDCMGHGVSASFISIVMNMLLKEIVLVRKQVHPEEILHQVEKELSRVFQVTQEYNFDVSADIAICSIAKTIAHTFYINFAGARRPLLYTFQNQVLYFKGNRVSVGLHVDWDHAFENEAVELSKGDRIFMYSDGLTDQNNSQGKKFGENRLISVLQNSISRTLQEQLNSVEKALLEYQGTCPQRDDVLMIGIEL